MKPGIIWNGYVKILRVGFVESKLEQKQFKRKGPGGESDGEKEKP